MDIRPSIGFVMALVACALPLEAHAATNARAASTSASAVGPAAPTAAANARPATKAASKPATQNQQNQQTKRRAGGKPGSADREGAVQRDERGPTNTGTGTGVGTGPN